MGIPNLRAIRDWCKETFPLKQEILDTKDLIEANKEPGKLADALVIKEVFQSVSNGKELIASAITDKGIEADAGDTFAEMADKITRIVSSSDSGGGDVEGGLISPLPVKISHSGDGSTAGALDIRTYFPIRDVNKLVIKSLNIGAKKVSTSASNVTIIFQIYGRKSGSTADTMITSKSIVGNDTTMKYATISEEEIDLTEFNFIEYLRIYKAKGSGTVYQYSFSADAELELYF